MKNISVKRRRFLSFHWFCLSAILLNIAVLAESETTAESGKSTGLDSALEKQIRANCLEKYKPDHPNSTEELIPNDFRVYNYGNHNGYEMFVKGLVDWVADLMDGRLEMEIIFSLWVPWLIWRISLPIGILLLSPLGKPMKKDFLPRETYTTWGLPIIISFPLPMSKEIAGFSMQRLMYKGKAV